MNAVSSELLDAVRRVVESGPLAKSVRNVQIEPGCDDDDEEFLRVELLVKMPDRDIDEQLEVLLQEIEEAVARLDDRYASVRFLDAA